MVRGNHADDSVFVLIELNLLTDDVGVGSEVASPESVVQDGNRIAARPALAVVEDAAEEGLVRSTLKKDAETRSALI